MQTVKERLIAFLSYKKLGQKAFAEKVGVSSGYVNAIRVSIQPKTLDKISEVFPELNISWLLTGEGQMLKVSDELASMNLLDPVNQTPKVKMVPLISLDALGGFGNNSEQGEEFTEKLIPWENALEGDFAVMLSGTSMMPVIMPGSYVLLRKVEGWREFLEYNILYVLELLDFRRLLKLVQKSDNPDCLTLISYNPNNPPQDIKTSFIGKVFKVVGIKTDFSF